MNIKCLDALACLISENYKDASFRLSNISIVDDPSLLKLVSFKDLAYYLTLTSLYSLNRKELKQIILTSSNLKNLQEIAPDSADIIENFLNGRYTEFQASLSKISSQLKYDMFFGHKMYRIVE